MILIPKHTMLRPHGTVHLTGDGPDIIRDTVQCCHCGRHGVFQPGCGRKLGRCEKCHAPTCGEPGCEPCVPYEKRLDLIERQTLIHGA
jgi:hypothetical protein